MAVGPSRPPAGDIIRDALTARGLGHRTLARARIAEKHPDINGVDRERRIERVRRQIQKWCAEDAPVSYLEPGNAEWVARHLGIPVDRLVKPEPTEDDLRTQKIARLEAEVARLRAEAQAAAGGRAPEPHG